MPIIRRNNYVYVTLGTCYSVWMTVWYAGWNETPPSVPDSNPHRITSTKCHINTVVSLDDGHKVARNMSRLINIVRINCAPSWLYLQDFTRMHGQQNIKLRMNGTVPCSPSHHYWCTLKISHLFYP